jgi:hypothetical protein
MEQLSLDSIGDQDVITSEEWPTSYRTDARGVFVVTADVPGVGKIVARHRFLYQATLACREQIRLALATRPSTMF